MIKIKFLLVLMISAILLGPGCKDEPGIPAGNLQLVNILIGTTELDLNDQEQNTDLPVDRAISITFSSPLNTETVPNSLILLKEGQPVNIEYSYSDNDKTVSLIPVQVLDVNQIYIIEITANLKGKSNESFPGFSIEFITQAGQIVISAIKVGDVLISGTEKITNVPLDTPIEITFSSPLEVSSVTASTLYVSGSGIKPALNYSFSEQNKKVLISPVASYHDLTKYSMVFTSQIKGAEGERFSPYSRDFYTVVDPTPKFPVISDDELLTLVQQQTFRYFWDFGHPTSGLSRERNTSGNTVTSGGSGFGIMAIIVGMERQFITREEGVTKLQLIVDFLGNADRFHGAWSHWLHGETGASIPFSTQDNGGDLVETSYLAMGLLTARQYLDPSDPAENELISDINTLWETIEWSWYTREGQKTLYWHWSPDFGWAMNMQIKGFNEALITYVMAASSPTYGIDLDTYTQGWTNSSYFINGKTFYGYTLPLGFDYGGPLFFAQYSFLGINPNGLSDSYADYMTQNINHTLINREYCILNPKNFVGYSSECWGLTASDNQSGYSAHSPTNDLGVITPTAAISSIPYTPEYSMDAIKFFYYTLGDRLWGDYGFYDAFNITEGWTADSYLAIDQGPIIVMIENHRTGLLWNLFMSCPEVQQGLDKLGFNLN